MKNLVILLAISSFFFLSCSAQEKNPVEGMWEMHYSEWKFNGETSSVFQRSEVNRHKKAFSKKHFCWIHQSPENDTTDLGYTYGGGGTYTLRGDTIFGTPEISPWKNDIGRTGYSTFEIRGDTLIETYPETTDENGTWSGVEIHLRLE